MILRSFPTLTILWFYDSMISITVLLPSYYLFLHRISVLYTQRNILLIISSKAWFEKSYFALHCISHTAFQLNTAFHRVIPHAFHKNDAIEIQSCCSVTILGSYMVAIGRSQSFHYKMRLKINSYAGNCCGKISGQFLFIKLRTLCECHISYSVCFDGFALCRNLTTG